MNAGRFLERVIQRRAQCASRCLFCRRRITRGVRVLALRTVHSFGFVEHGEWHIECPVALALVGVA